MQAVIICPMFRRTYCLCLSVRHTHIPFAALRERDDGQVSRIILNHRIQICWSCMSLLDHRKCLCLCIKKTLATPQQPERGFQRSPSAGFLSHKESTLRGGAEATKKKCLRLQKLRRPPHRAWPPSSVHHVVIFLTTQLCNSDRWLQINSSRLGFDF